MKCFVFTVIIDLAKSETMEEKQAITRFAALAHELRYKVFRMLTSRGTKGHFAGELARQLDVPSSTLSPHLSRLEREELIVSEKQGSHILYKIKPEGIAELIDHLVEDCCEGRPELCGGVLNKQGACAE